MVLLSYLPLKFHYFMGGILTWIFEKLLKYRYATVMINLSRSFPEKKYAELCKIAHQFYVHLGEIFAETIWFSGGDYNRLKNSGIVKIVNPEVLSDYFERGPSVTLLSTHCGNWEILGGLFVYYDATGKEYPFTQDHVRMVYKKLSSDVSDEVFRRNRIAVLEKGGEDCVIESAKILRYAVSHRAEKMIYVYPTDQSPYSSATRYYMGEFLHQPTYTMQGAAGLACKLSHSVLYVKMKRVERGRYELSFIPICDDASASSPEELMKKYYELLEEEIVETPANWLWSHKRWKF